MRLLRIIDCDERPSMGYVYEGMYMVPLGINKLFNYNKRLYKPYRDHKAILGSTTKEKHPFSSLLIESMFPI